MGAYLCSRRPAQPVDHGRKAARNGRAWHVHLLVHVRRCEKGPNYFQKSVFNHGWTRMDTDRKGQFDPLNTRNYAKGGEFDSDPGFAVRVKAGSGASTSPFSRCLAGPQHPTSNIQLRTPKSRTKPPRGKARSRKQKAEMAGKATPSHLNATSMRVGSQLIGTPMRPPCDPHATHKPPLSHLQATVEPKQRAESRKQKSANGWFLGAWIGNGRCRSRWRRWRHCFPGAGTLRLRPGRWVGWTRSLRRHPGRE